MKGEEGGGVRGGGGNQRLAVDFRTKMVNSPVFENPILINGVWQGSALLMSDNAALFIANFPRRFYLLESVGDTGYDPGWLAQQSCEL